LANAALQAALQQMSYFAQTRPAPYLGSQIPAIPRGSFDEEVNDVLELAQLCVYRGLNARTI
jgi:hypothetical protein